MKTRTGLDSFCRNRRGERLLIFRVVAHGPVAATPTWPRRPTLTCLASGEMSDQIVLSAAFAGSERRSVRGRRRGTTSASVTGIRCCCTVAGIFQVLSAIPRDSQDL